MRNRRVEYYSAWVMVGWAAVLAMPGDTITERDAFAPFLARGWSEIQLALILGVVGVLWLGALWVNGHHRRSPVVRCMGALAGTVMWSHIAVMLGIHSYHQGVWTTGIAAYGFLAIFDLLSCYRSAIDAFEAHLRGKALDKLVNANDA